MPEWWTYELSNFLLFSPETYDRLIESYNREMWPWQVVALLSGIVLLSVSARRAGRRAQVVTTLLLAASWLSVAWAFHLQRYAPINFAAKWFALAFAAEAALLIATELVARKGTRPEIRPVKASGLTLAIFALGILPVLQLLLGRSWAQVEIFALFPDATAILTLGLLLARERIDWHLFVIPVAWSAIGSATSHALGRPDAPFAIVAAVLALGMVAWKAVARRRIGPA